MYWRERGMYAEGPKPEAIHPSPTGRPRRGSRLISLPSQP